MFRFLFIVIAIWLAILIIRHLYRSSRGRARREEAAAELPADTVRCAHCGVHVPKSEAIRDADRFFCCEAHRREARE